MSESIEQNRPVDEDHWEIYVTYVDDNPAVIMVNIGVAKSVPLLEMPHLAWLWVELQSPDDEGFPSEDEDMKLNEIEDLINDAVEQPGIRYAGRITSNGRREFYFYTGNPQQFRESATAAMQSVPEYQYEIDDAEDPEWRHYLDVLYPGPEDFQQIHNQHVIARLQMEGDTLSTPRPVDHFANFKTVEDREAFIVSASAEGFEAASRPDREAETEFPFSVGLLRIDSVDPETIDRVTFELFEMAQQHAGEYEGWGSKVVKS